MSSPCRDVASSGWQISLERSRERRAAARLRRRRIFQGRSAVLMAVLAMTGLSGIAVAATSGGSVQASRAITTLHPGDRGAAVRLLQRKLGIAADGVYGRATKRAVRRFQARHRLTVDGVAGPATLRALGIRARAASGSGGAGWALAELGIGLLGGAVVALSGRLGAASRDRTHATAA